MAVLKSSDAPSERLVRHVFWKYPIIAVILLLVVAVVAAIAGSPNYPRVTIAGVMTENPGGGILAFTQELDGTSASSQNASEFGVGSPAQTFVLNPLRAALPLLGAFTPPQLPTLQTSDVQKAVSTYDAAGTGQQVSWAANYDKALGTITPMAETSMGVASPDYAKVGALRGDFGPIPTLVEANLHLAQTGYLEQYLQSVDPGHSFHLTNICLYDHPGVLNSAVGGGLTDDQWGMVKERGFPVGPWYLFVPAVFHVYFPGGATGPGFVLWNLAFAAILLFVLPLVPGIRSLPRRLKLYRFIYRYPRTQELAEPALRERHGPVHGGTAAGG